MLQIYASALMVASRLEGVTQNPSPWSNTTQGLARDATDHQVRSGMGRTFIRRIGRLARGPWRG